MAQEFTVFVSVPGTDRPWLKTFTRPAIVGRSDDCDIPLAHPVVSRQHAEVRRAPDGDLIVRDLGSTNGTISGNEVLRGHEIRAPEQISLQIGSPVGETTLSLLPAPGLVTTRRSRTTRSVMRRSRCESEAVRLGAPNGIRIARRPVTSWSRTRSQR